MNTIPASVTEEQFEKYIRPYLKTVKRWYECKIKLYKIFNYILKRQHTGCQWHRIQRIQKSEISRQAVYYHWQKWNKAGCFEQVWQHSIELVQDEIDCTYLNLDGSHTIAKKGCESVAYQYRKRTKANNILPITNAQGIPTTD